MHKIGKKKIRMLKRKQRDKIWIVRWKTKGPIDAVSAWSVYMYVYQYEHAPLPSTVPNTPHPYTHIICTLTKALKVKEMNR